MTLQEKYQGLKQWYNDHRSELQSQPAMVTAVKENHVIRNYIYDLWFALFNKPLGGCSQCFADALIYLLHKSTEEKMKNITNCRFKLKPGVLLSDVKHRLPDATTANLTDDLAIAYLKDNPRRAQFFDTIPEGWDKEPEAEAEESVSHETPVAKTTKKTTRKKTTKK